MDIIRKRRDALIAKAKGPAERNLEAGEGQDPVMMETTACESEKVPSLERCHGCGVGVKDAWRRGPDGPRSLCDICGVSIFSKVHEDALTWLSCITQDSPRSVTKMTRWWRAEEDQDARGKRPFRRQAGALLVTFDPEK